MRTLVDLTTGVATINPSPVAVKRGDDLLCEIQFRKDGAAVLLEVGWSIVFSAKLKGKPSTGFVMHGTVFTAPNSAAGYYTGYITANTTQMADALGIATDTPNGTGSVDLDGEISFINSGHQFSTQTFPVRASNDITKGNESDPINADPSYPAKETIVLLSMKGAANGVCDLDSTGHVPAARLFQRDRFLPTVNAPTGSNSLAAVATAGGAYATGSFVNFFYSDDEDTMAVRYVLVESTTPTSTDPAELYFHLPFYVRPNDYNASTNARVWRIQDVEHQNCNAADGGQRFFGIGPIYSTGIYPLEGTNALNFGLGASTVNLNGAVQCNSTIRAARQFTLPPSPAANTGILYTALNGSNKMQWLARFPSGASVVIATEP